jgi:hydroxymethylglutaryl-CoA synthase
MTMGITGYGTYIPRYRLGVADIAAVWKKDAADIVGALGVTEKSVPGVDEDAVTVAIEAASDALTSSGIPASSVEALFVGSESHPYAVNPTATIVGQLLGVGHDYLAADMEFACKAGTAGIQAVAGLVSSGHIQCGMAIGADTAQSRPHDALEYTSATAGVAMLLGTAGVAAELAAYTSYSSDTPDFWRRDGIRYPSHAGRFTGEPAYFAHVTGAAKRLMDQTGIKPQDVTYCVFHMPNGKFPRAVAKRLGVSPQQLAPSLTVDAIGNPYSASAMLGLAAVLDIAKAGDTVFMVSYGSGAGSDAFLWKVTERITAIQKERKAAKTRVADLVGRKVNIGYTEYLKQTHKI